MRLSSVLLFLLLGPCCNAQAWSGVLSSSRAINWATAGLPATLPDGETTVNPWTPPARATKCGSTVSSGASASAINSAISACTAGEHVQLPCDKSITISGANVQLYGQNSYTLRGCGADQTTIYLPSSVYAGTDVGAGSGTATWTSGFSQGATTISISSVGSLLVGETVLTLAANTGTVDTGDVFSCVSPSTSQPICTTEGGVASQYQNVIVTQCDSVTTIGHACVSGANITISPGLYMPNWAALSSPNVAWVKSTPYGIGLEDMTIDCTGNTTNACLYFLGTYASWMKGVRVISGKVGQEQMNLNTTKNVLVFNDYFTQPLVGLETIVLNATSDDLILNNISENGALLYYQSPGSGDVAAYNLLHFSNNNAGSFYQDNIFVTHTNGYSFLLWEGNELGAIQDDNIHGTHNFDTAFRNMVYTTDPPYTVTNSNQGISMMGYSRFMNIIGNVLGCSGYPTCPAISTYKVTPANTASYTTTIYNIGAEAGFEFPIDPISVNSTMFWGNYDTVTNAVRWCGNSSNPGWSTTCSSTSEVPASLNTTVGYSQSLSGSGSGPYTATLSHTPCVYGNNIILGGGTTAFGYDFSLNGTITGTGISSGTVNCSTGAVSITFTGTPSSPVIQYLNQTGTASPYLNAVPSSTTLPASFFISGGTPSWWTVCTNYPTCSATATEPFPPFGPDKTGGTNQYNTSGFAFHAPTYDAWLNLPIDTTCSNCSTAFSITGSSWSGGTETLTVSGLNASYYYSGGFQISGGTCGGTAEHLMTSSNTTTIQYAAASNPGSCTGGSMLYPDVRTFNESIYGATPSPPTAPQIPLPRGFFVEQHKQNAIRRIVAYLLPSRP